jgi:hypothetical protein
VNISFLQKLHDLHSGYVSEGPAQVRIACAGGQIRACIKGGPVEIQTATHWNRNDRRMTAPPPVLSPSNILPPASSHWSFNPARKKFGALLENVISFFFAYFIIA